MQMHSAAIATMTKDYREQKVKIGEQRRMIAEQDRQLQEQARLVTELKSRMQGQEKSIELLAAHLAAVTGKEVALPEPQPWDQTLWDRSPRATASSSQDSGMSEEGACRKLQHRLIPAECGDAEVRVAAAPPKMDECHHHHPPLAACPRKPGRCSKELPLASGLEQMERHMNELCPGLSAACPTQHLFTQIALGIHYIAAEHKLPLRFVLGEASLERGGSGGDSKDPKDPSSVLGAQLATARQQLANLHEEHGGCTLCSEAISSAFAFLLPSVSRPEAVGLVGSPPPTNQGLFNRAQELYNRLAHLQPELLNKPLFAPCAKEAGDSDEEASAEPAGGRGKGKGLLKRGRSASKSRSDEAKVGAGDNSKATSRGRKRRKR